MVLLAFIAGLIGGVVSTQLFIGQNIYTVKSIKPQKVIEAKEFRVVDENGGTLATLGLGIKKEYGSPGVELRMFTAAYGKKSGIMITAEESHSSMNIYGNDSNNNIGIEMKVFNSSPLGSSGFASLQVGYSGIDLDAILKGEKIVEENKSYIELSSGKSGATLGLFDKEGKSRSILGSINLETTKTGEISKRPESSLVLFDKDGKVIWSIP